jgi:hypothetical protein
MKRVLLGRCVGVALLLSARAEASCTCQCVDGEMQPLCSSSIDIPPICPPRICPIDGPSIAPINPPTIPPLGTSSCRQARICDPYGNCRWQQVCE